MIGRKRRHVMGGFPHLFTMFGELLRSVLKTIGTNHSGPWTPFLQDTSPLHPWFLASFVLGGGLVYGLTKAVGESFSLKNAVRFVFPKSLYRHPSTRMDVWSYIINYSVFVPSFGIFGAMVLTGNALYDRLVVSYGDPTRILSSDWGIIGTQFTLVWLAEDVVGYAYHYLNHMVPALWRIHRVHHSAETLMPLTANRNHPVEQALQVILVGATLGMFSGVTMYLTGVKFGATTLSLIAAGRFTKNLMQNFRHSHIWISYGPLDRFIISPCMHQIHHSVLPQHRDKNLGQTLTLWDYLFGTLYVPNGQEEFPLGISADEIGVNNPHRTLKGFYFEPVVTMFRVLTGAKPIPDSALARGRRTR